MPEMTKQQQRERVKKRVGSADTTNHTYYPAKENNQYVKTDSFRQGIVNKRSNPDYVNLSEKLTDFRAAAVSENQVTQWYIILNEHIYGSDESNFTSRC